jgi:hypothetical protein
LLFKLKKKQTFWGFVELYYFSWLNYFKRRWYLFNLKIMEVVWNSRTNVIVCLYFVQIIIWRCMDWQKNWERKKIWQCMWHSGGDKQGYLIFLMTQSGVMTEKTFNFLVTSYSFFLRIQNNWKITSILSLTQNRIKIIFIILK